MKYLTAIASFVFLLGAGVANAGAAIRLSVDVADKTRSQAVLVYQTTIVEIPLDEKGHGECVLENLPAVHADFYYGMDSKKIFFEDGDKIEIAFDGKNFGETFVFRVGNNPAKEKICKYLNEITLPALSNDDFALPFDDYAALLVSKERTALRLLKAWKLDAVSPLFAKIEENRIRYALASMLLMYPVGYTAVTQDASYRPDSAYYDAIATYVREDRDLVGLKEYREYMKEAAYVLSARGQRITDPYKKTLCEMEFLIDRLADEVVLQNLLNVLAIEQVEQYGIDGIDDLLNYHRTFVTDPVLQAAFREKYDRWDVVRKGKPSPDFRAFDKDGTPYTLENFKGRYLYIDLWATWCIPCRREIPFLRKLEQEYEGRNIAFVSLSIDERSAEWKDFLEKQTMTGTQLYLGSSSSFAKLYKVNGIPRFILLDPDGNIVDENALRPSSPDIRACFDALPGMSR